MKTRSLMNSLKRIFILSAHSHPPSSADPPRSPRESMNQRYQRLSTSRRSLIKGSAVAASSIALVAPLLWPRDQKMPRVVIIGAGLAGLNAAYQLKKRGISATVYEAQKRVGGRIWTSRQSWDMLFELGGELIDSNHKTMISLAQELEIQLDDRWSFETSEMVRETWYIQGKHVSAELLIKQVQAVAPVLSAQYREAEREDDPSEFNRLNHMSLQEWLNRYIPTSKYPELHEVLRIAFVGEYGLEADEQSALNLLYLFGFTAKDEFLIFGESDERWHAHTGNDTFTTRLAQLIGDASIKTEHILRAVSGSSQGPYTLQFEGREPVTADHLIFTLPYSVMRRLDLSQLELTPKKREIIDHLSYGHNTKVMGKFDSRPWWTDHQQSGLLVTDLSVQQGWDTTIGQELQGDPGVWTNFLGGDQGLKSVSIKPEDWFHQVVEQLDEIWPGAQEAWSGEAKRMHWPSFPWARGSYTCYTPGQWDYWSLEGAQEGRMYFCGEHTSVDFQGWMEGAAESGARVALEVERHMRGEVNTHQSSLPQEINQYAMIASPQRWMCRSKRLALRDSLSAHQSLS